MKHGLKIALPVLSCGWTTWEPCAVERDVHCVPLVQGSARVRRVRIRRSM